MAWTLATGAAVTLSWWGVHTVMSGTAYDPPLAVPLTTQPLSSSTHGDRTGEPTEPGSPSPSPSPVAPAAASAPASVTPSPAAPSPPKASGKAAPGARPSAQAGGEDAGRVKAYPVSGGRVVFDLGESSAELVSATPAAGWRMQVWKLDTWIRVTFTRDDREVSVFCTWHDHPPRVEIVDP